MLNIAEALDRLPWRCSGSPTRQDKRLCLEACCSTGAPLGRDKPSSLQLKFRFLWPIGQEMLEY